MRKILVPILFLLLIAGSAYAALVAGLFPNTADFPRMPTWEGTIGSTLSKLLAGGADLATYAGDGTVKNTLALDGKTATGYLQHKECSISDEVWLSISPEGNPQCSTKGGPYAKVMGTLTGVLGNVTITKHDSTSSVGTNGDTLYYGDIISTAGTSSGTIAFADTSIIRLDELTTVTLSGGTNSSGNTIAQVILSDGNLWGRVLTSTGINFEAGGYIAGVRGTSISVEKSSTGYTFAIVDSIANGNNAVGIHPKVVVGPATIESSTTKLGSGSMIHVDNDPSILTLYESNILKSTLLTGNEWRSFNTVADIEYLYNLSTDPLVIMPTLTTEQVSEIQTKAGNEVDVTIPKITDLENCTKKPDGTTTCDTDAGTLECIALGGTSQECIKINSLTDIPDDVIDSAGGMTPDPDAEEKKKGRREIRARDVICSKLHDGIFWPTLGKCIKKTATNNTILWLADYTQGSQYTDPTIFVDQKLRSDKLTTFKNSGGSPSDLPLIGKNFRIKAQYEKFYGNTIKDDCKFQKSSTWWGTVNNKNNGIISEISSLSLADNGDFYTNSSLYSSLFGYDAIFISNPTNSSKCTEINGWDESTFTGGIWLRKNLLALTSGSNGVDINTIGQYIAYPLSELGGGASLAGKTITIEYYGAPTNLRSLLYLGSSYSIKWQGSPVYNWISTSSSLLPIINQTPPSGGNPGSVSIKVDSAAATNITQFIIGNTSMLTQGHIGITIKRVTITN